MSLASQESSYEDELVKDSHELVKEVSSEVLPSTYQIRPTVQEAFRTTTVKEIILNVLTETLTGKKYSETESRKWTKHIADTISIRVKELSMKRYKHIVQVVLGNQLGAGCKYIARCRWDAECDNQTSDVFTNATIFCVVTVFGTYHY